MNVMRISVEFCQCKKKCLPLFGTHDFSDNNVMAVSFIVHPVFLVRLNRFWCMSYGEKYWLIWVIKSYENRRRTTREKHKWTKWLENVKSLRLCRTNCNTITVVNSRLRLFIRPGLTTSGCPNHRRSALVELWKKYQKYQ